MMLSKGWLLVCLSACSILLVNIVRNNKKILANVVPLSITLIMPVLIGLSCFLFNKSLYYPAFFIFLPAMILFAAYFYLRRVPAEKFINIGIVYNEQSTSTMALKIGSAVAAGVAGYFMLDRKMYIFSYLLYAVSFILMVRMFKIKGHTPLGEVEQAAVGRSGSVGITQDAGVFFAAFITVILAFKAYSYVMAFDVKNFLICLALAAVFAAFAADSFKAAGLAAKTENDKLVKFDYVFLAVVFIYALVIRSIDCLGLPPGLQSDDINGLIGVGSVNSGRSTLYFTDLHISILPLWMSSVIGKLFGLMPIYAVKAPHIILGALNIPFIYLLAKELYNRRVAVVSSLILSVFFMHVFFSRAIPTWIEVPAFGTAAFYFFIVALKRGKPLPAVLGGIMLSLSMYSYDAGKLVPIVILFYFAAIILSDNSYRKFLNNRTYPLLLFASASFLAFYPILIYILTKGSEYFALLNRVSVFHYLSAQTPAFATLAGRAAIYVCYLFKGNVFSASMPSANILDPVGSAMMLAGFCVIFSGLRRGNNIFMLAWLFAGSLGAFFSSSVDGFEPPRIVLIYPAFAILMALGLDYFAASIDLVLKKQGKIISAAVVLTALVFITFFGLHTYFVQYKNDPVVKMIFNEYALEIKNFVSSHKKDDVIVSDFYNSNRGVTFAYLMYGEKMNFRNMDVSLLELNKIYNNRGQGVIIIAEGMYAEYMDIFRKFFPNAVIKTHWNYDWWLFGPGEKYMNLYGWKNPVFTLNKARTFLHDVCIDPVRPQVNFVSCEIPYGDIKDLYGLKTVYSNKGRIIREIITTDMTIIKDASFDSADFSGGIYAPETGWYVLTAQGAVMSGLSVGDADTKKNDCVYLKRGLNSIGFKLDNFHGADATVFWVAQGGSGFEKLPAGNVIDITPEPALNSYIEKNGKKLYESLDYGVNNRIYFAGARLPVAVTAGFGHDKFDRIWDGYITIDKTGYYEIMAQTPNDCTVKVDESAVFSKKSGIERSNERWLSKGKHKIKVRQVYEYLPNVDSYHIWLLKKKRGDNLPSVVLYSQLSGK